MDSLFGQNSAKLCAPPNEISRGVSLADTSGLTSSEFASVLAMNGTTGAVGDGIGNSWTYRDLAEAFNTQCGGAAIVAERFESSTKHKLLLLPLLTVLTWQKSRDLPLVLTMRSLGTTASKTMVNTDTTDSTLGGTMAKNIRIQRSQFVQLPYRQLVQSLLNSLMAT